MHFQKPILGTPLDWENPLNRDTVLAYALNEGHGDKVQDLSMNGNHGTLNNFAFPPTVNSGWNPGLTGVAVRFDGFNDHINCGNNPTLDTAGSFTHSFLMYHDERVHGDYTNFQTVVSKNKDDTNGSKQFYWYSVGNEYRFRIRWADGSSTSVQLPAADAPIKTWHIVTTVYDSNLGEMILYLNGNEAVAPVDVSAKTGIVNTEPFEIGRLSNYNGFFFNGIIDEVRSQSRAWTAKEVKDYAINPWQVYLDEEDM